MEFLLKSDFQLRMNALITNPIFPTLLLEHAQLGSDANPTSEMNGKQ